MNPYSSQEVSTGFTVYDASNHIVLRSGFEDLFGWKVICSSFSHTQAYETAQRVSERKNLPLKLEDQQ